MKDFLKMTGAAIVGFLIVSVISWIFIFAIIGSLASLGQQQPVMPRSAVLRIDLSTVSLGEQTREIDPLSAIQGNTAACIGILDAIRAIEAAAADPAIQYIYLKPDMVTGGMAEIEELRKALTEFRMSGKPVISYIENPTNAGYYLASASDKVYMTPHAGGVNMLTGLSSQMIFLKDILDKLGVNVQLIRHGKYKSAGEMFIRNSPSEENLTQNRELVESIWNSWSEEIAASRNITVGEFNDAVDNLELNFPQDYVDCGLVDELLTQDELKNKLASYSGVTDFSDVSQIGIADYALLKVVPNYKASKKVAVIYAEGDIVDGSGNNGVAADRFASIISDVRQDESVKAVVFRVNSPGGSVLAAEKIRDEISLLAAEKPVVASFGDYAASGGYWISAGCERIFTNRSTLTGSIGVFSMIPDFSGTLDKIANVNITSVNSSDHADMYSGFRPLSDNEIRYMQASVENIYDRFTGIVSEGRNVTKEYVDSIAQGRVWSGADAAGLGLADTEGSIMDALRYAVSYTDESGIADLTQWQIVEYPKPLTTLETIMQAFESSSVSVFADTPFSEVEKTFRHLDMERQGTVYARMPYELIIR